jgi:hypothetical protein
MTLTLHKTVIGGETFEDDYTVHFDGLQIGRIFRKIGVGAQAVLVVERAAHGQAGARCIRNGGHAGRC